VKLTGLFYVFEAEKRPVKYFKCPSIFLKKKEEKIGWEFYVL
jgi:hypothetical protein